MSYKSADTVSAPTRLQTIERLVPVMMGEVTKQLPAFVDRLCAAMSKSSEQTVRSKEVQAEVHGEVQAAFHVSNYLKKNTALFRREFLATMSTMLVREIAALSVLASQSQHPRIAASATPAAVLTDQAQHQLAMLSQEEIENQDLIGSISRSIELKNSSALVAFNFHLCHVLQLPDLSMSHNPFRPAICVRAVFNTWCEFDPIAESRQLALQVMQPDVFFDFEPILAAMNAALVAQGIVPVMTDAYRRSRSSCPSSPPLLQAVAIVPIAEISLQEKIQRWLRGSEKRLSQGASVALPFDRRSMPEHQSAEFTAVSSVSGAWFMDGSTELVTLRDVARNAPAGRFGITDYNTIELLARIYDFIFSDRQIPTEIKNLLRHLQMPLLQTALRDKAFFQNQSHPARRLLDQLIQSSIGASIPISPNDPLYKMIEQIVDRLRQEFDQQSGMECNVVANLAADLTSDLTSFLDDQQRNAEAAVQSHISAALQEEKMRRAQMAAASDIAACIESGEVAGFVEQFLESQWLRVLTLTHSVADCKPKALANARNAMDELIWSVKPKTSAADRAALISKLPAMLSLVNAWLNLIKCNEPARVTFFSKLVERHAAIVQQPIECSPRHQLHLAVNVAQKASERRLSQRAREMDATAVDQFADLVDSVKVGSWIEFIRHNGLPSALRLVWVSPLRGSFIFCNRQNDAPFSLTAEELAAAMRDQSANVLRHESLTTRALVAALQHMDEGD